MLVNFLVNEEKTKCKVMLRVWWGVSLKKYKKYKNEYKSLECRELFFEKAKQRPVGEQYRLPFGIINRTRLK